MIWSWSVSFLTPLPSRSDYVYIFTPAAPRDKKDPGTHDAFLAGDRQDDIVREPMDDPPPLRRRYPPYLLPNTSSPSPVSYRYASREKNIVLLPHDGLAQKLDAQGAPLVEANAFFVHPFAQEVLVHHGAGSDDEEARHVEILAEKVADLRPLPYRHFGTAAPLW